MAKAGIQVLAAKGSFVLVRYVATVHLNNGPITSPTGGEWLLAHAWLPTAGDGLGVAAPWGGRALTALEMLHREGCRHW